MDNIADDVEGSLTKQVDSCHGDGSHDNHQHVNTPDTFELPSNSGKGAESDESQLTLNGLSDLPLEEEAVEEDKISPMASHKSELSDKRLNDEVISADLVTVNLSEGNNAPNANFKVQYYSEESASHSEDEKLPELLSNKESDCDSEIVDSEGIDKGYEVPGLINSDGLSFTEENTSLENSLLNSVPRKEECSSDDDIVPSTVSTSSDVTSSESDLSDSAAAGLEAAASPENHSRKIDPSVLVAKSQHHFDNDDGLTNVKDPIIPLTQELPEPKQRERLALSVGTQTSFEHCMEEVHEGGQGGIEHLSKIKAPFQSESAEGLARIPLFYKPEIFMLGRQHTLALRPVMNTSLDENKGENCLPIILPLSSPSIDEETREFLFQKLKIEKSPSGALFCTKVGNSGNVADKANKVEPVPEEKVPTEKAEKDDKPSAAVEIAFEISSEVDEDLPEWIQPSELEKAFSAAEQETSVTSSDRLPFSKDHTVTLPKTSLPSTNPFAQDLATLDWEEEETEVTRSEGATSEVTVPYSLYGPPSSTQLSPGARPKESKADTRKTTNPFSYGTNPFAPDLSPKMVGRIQESEPSDATEIVVAADVHARTAKEPYISHRRQMSDASMVTLFETTSDEAAPSDLEICEATDEITKPVQAPENSRGGKNVKPVKSKPQMPGSVAPIWIQDASCTSCMHCQAKFTVVRRKHHCRVCGKIFCHSCCSQLARLPYMEYKIGRVCVACTERIREVLQNKKQMGSSTSQNSQHPSAPVVAVSNAPGESAALTGVSVSRGQTPGQRVSVQAQQLPSQSEQPGKIPSMMSQHQLVQSPSVGTYQSTKQPVQSQKPGNQSITPQQLQNQLSQFPGYQNPSLHKQGLSKLPANISNAQSKSVQPLQLPKPLSQVEQSPNPSASVQQWSRSPATLQYQLVPNPAAQPQLVTAQVPASKPSNQLQQGGQPPSQGTQIMWVPAAALQQNMPVVFMNPAAPGGHTTPVYLTYPQGGQVVPQQTPVFLIPNQPAVTTQDLGRANQHIMKTVSSNTQRQEPQASLRNSFDTVTTFSVLPQDVGQLAVDKFEAQQSGGVPRSKAVNDSYLQNVTTADAVPHSSNCVTHSSLLTHDYALVSSASLTQNVTTQSGFKHEYAPERQNGRPVTQPTVVQPNPAPFSSGSSPQNVTTVNRVQQVSEHSTSKKFEDSVTTTDQQLSLSSNGLTSSIGAAMSSKSEHVPLITSAPVMMPNIASLTTSSQEQSKKPAVTTVGSPTRPANVSSSQEQEIPTPRESEGSVLLADENGDLKTPFRRAGRTISWRYRTQSKSKLHEQRKSLARDLKDLPNGVTVRASLNFLVHVKRMKLKGRQKDTVSLWCFQSEGLNKFNHLEVVFLLEIKRREEVFPEEVLRIYRAILHLAKLGNRFQHGNYLSSNNQFLDSSDDAAFMFVSSEVKRTPVGLKEMPTPFLYAVLIKRSELSAAMFTPSRLLLRLGLEMNCFPFPIWNPRDRKALYLGSEQDDRFFHTVFAMNKYLKNSVPEAMFPGLYIVKEGNKIVLQAPYSGQSTIVNLLDRLIIKENQTATVPLLGDTPCLVDSCKVVVCGELGRSVLSFANPALKTNSTHTSVVGLSFLLLHLGVDASSPLSYGGELLDDGVVIFFSKTHTQKLRQSLETKSNCYFYLGDNFDIAHFELRWIQDTRYHESPQATGTFSTQTASGEIAASTPLSTSAQENGTDYHAGLAVIDIRHAGYRNEVDVLKKAFMNFGSILRDLEDDIRLVCTTPLMKHANKMPSGTRQEMQLRVVLKPSYKKWSVGPSDLPIALIRSLQMALATVRTPEVFEGELVMNFNVTVVKQ